MASARESEGDLSVAQSDLVAGGSCRAQGRRLRLGRARQADEWSDLDLVIIADTARPFLERYRDFEGIYEVWRRLDPLIYTPEEFEQMGAEGRAFSGHILQEGVIVHEAPAGG